jgi:hypothetical protein
MTRSLPILLQVFALTYGVASGANSLLANGESVTNLPESSARSLPGVQLSNQPTPAPPLPGMSSPVQTLRELLAMKPEERERALASRSEPNRKYLQGRLQEFQAMPATEREAKFNQLELVYWLPSLMRLAPSNRTGLLKAVPAPLIPIIQERLKQWDLLPPKLQSEVLDYDTTSDFFLRTKPAAQLVSQRSTGTVGSPSSSADQDHDHVVQTVRQIFSLPAREQEKTLSNLSPSERAQMENAMAAFSKLAPEERNVCINSFEKFSRMTPEERGQFLKNAERWKAMSPRERETWRTLVRILPARSTLRSQPPLPPGAQAARNLSPTRLLPTSTN